MKTYKIVFLDAKTLGDDINLSRFQQFGEVVMYPSSTSEQAAERAKDADILIVNKVLVNEQTIGAADHLKLVCVTATGTNNLDKEYLVQRNIPWTNAAGYSSEIVAQHTFGLALYLLEQLPYYDRFVKDGDYVRSDIFTNLDRSIHQISGATWGIIGLGAIGRRVAAIAQAFGARVIYASASGSAPQAGYHQVSLPELYASSDIISIHAPLDENTENLINKESLAQMKPSAILLNLARGPIVVEEDLADALERGVIAGAGLDVLRQEPMSEDTPLARIEDSGKLIITPHNAWGSVEARTKLMDIVWNHVREFAENDMA